MRRPLASTGPRAVGSDGEDLVTRLRKWMSSCRRDELSEPIAREMQAS